MPSNAPRRVAPPTPWATGCRSGHAAGEEVAVSRAGQRARRRQQMPRRPAGRRRPPNEIKYALTTQARLDCVNPSWLRMVGRATSTAVVSRTTISIPCTRPRAHASANGVRGARPSPERASASLGSPGAIESARVTRMVPAAAGRGAAATRSARRRPVSTPRCRAVAGRRGRRAAAVRRAGKRGGERAHAPQPHGATYVRDRLVRQAKHGSRAFQTSRSRYWYGG